MNLDCDEKWSNDFDGIVSLLRDVFQMYGNPGDYAWGRGGLDVIVTQLLNQMDGTGPPPLKGETIEKIPKVKVTQEDVGKLFANSYACRL